MILAVTGHRPDKLGGWKIPNPTYMAVAQNIDKALVELKPEIVITGMALGVDQWMAELCIDSEIPFVAAVPFNGQEKMWPPHAQQKYHQLLQKAQQVIVISPGPYEPRKMHVRNAWMVDKSQLLLAVWNGTPGGTGACVDYALKSGHPIKFVELPKDIPEPPPRTAKGAVTPLPVAEKMEYDPMWNLFTPAAVPIPSAPKIPKPEKKINEPPGGGRYVDLGDE